MKEKWKKYMLLVITIAIIVFILIFFIIIQNPLLNLKYVNFQIGFGFNPPENWTRENYGDQREGRDVYHCRYFDNNNYSREISFGVMVMIKDEVNYSAESYYERVLQNEILDDPDNATALSYGERTVNEMKAYEIVFIVYDYYLGPFIDSEQYDQQAKLIFLESNNKLVMIDYRTLSFLYEKYDPIIEKSINSLVIV